MASSSNRRSSSSGRSSGRKKVVIGAEESSRVRSNGPKPEPKGLTRNSTRGGDGGRSQRPADRAVAARRAERERRLTRQRRVVQIRATVGLVVLAVLVLGIIGLYRSSIFEIAKVEVVGNGRLSVEEVLALAQIPDGATLLRYPAQEAKKRLESSPWIAEASLARDFPDTLRIRVTERTTFAILDLGGTKLWMLDETGIAIAEQTPDATSTAVVIRDVMGADPRPGVRSASEPVLNALAVWKGLSQSLREQTRAISASSIDKTALITRDDIEILVGAAEDIGKKSVLAEQILHDQAGKVVYINVRSVERPTWRGVDTP